MKFICKTHYKIKNKKAYEFGIVLKETNKVVGIVGLINIDWPNKNAEIGYWLGKRYWGQGLTKEAVKLILDFGFKKLKLHKIYAHLFEQNIGSKKLLEKSGFKLEGKLRETRYRNKQWHNELRYGILISEYKNHIGK